MNLTTIQQQSPKEYFQRINRVVDYIDAHIDEEHSLENLSQVAHFSPFHFHRIFRVLTGETLNNYIKRIRLQKAGSMLLSDYDRPVSEVYALCGFNSSAVFCRAFKMGLRQRSYKEKKLTHHSDRGLQYCCDEYQKVLAGKKVSCSMTESYDPYANAVAERVNGILKQEFLLEEYNVKLP